MDNDSRGLLFFILGFTCIWLVFDEFFGKKYISNLTNLLTPSIPSFGQSVKDAANSAAKSITDGVNGVTGGNQTPSDVKKGIEQGIKDKQNMPSSGFLPMG